MIFVAYAHKDVEYRNDFLRMIKPLARRYGGIKSWSDSQIQAGKDWNAEIKRALTATSVAVLLVTDSFLESDFIEDVELPYFLDAAKRRGLEIIWILVSDCLWEDTPLARLQAAYDLSKPLDSLSLSRQKTAWKEVAKKVKAAWKNFERPQINLLLSGRTVKRKEPSLQLLTRPARRQTEIFVRPNGPGQRWWHQCSIKPGARDGSCTFGDEKTKAGHRFDIVAMTTDQYVSGPSETLPEHRTRSAAVTVVRV
jgi:hypothetical protein